MKRLTALEMAAIVANPNNYVPIEDIVDEILEQNNPERNCLESEHETIRNKAWQALSEESKQVIEMMLDCPAELIGIITTCKQSNKICYRKVLSYLRRHWGERAIVKQVAKEIEKFALACADKEGRVRKR